MFERVVVGVDGRAGGRDAIALAQHLVRSSSGLVLANVYGTSALRGAAGAGWEAEHAHHLLSCTRLDHGLNCRTMVRLDSSPGRGLHRLAEHERADLIVVGSSHRGGLGRVVIGDDTLAALNGAPCAVAIAPRGFVFASPAWTAIGVGHDGSPESELALSTADELAHRHGAEVKVLTAHADAAEELTELSHTVNLLVVGSRGEGTLGRFVNGSVSGHLARHSACPLLVMHRVLTARAPRAFGGGSPDLRVPVG